MSEKLDSLMQEIELLVKKIEASPPPRGGRRTAHKSSRRGPHTGVYQIIDKTAKQILFTESPLVHLQEREGHQLVEFEDEKLVYARQVVSTLRRAEKFFRWRKTDGWEVIVDVQDHRIAVREDRYGGLEFEIISTPSGEDNRRVGDDIMAEIKLAKKVAPSPVITGIADVEPFLRWLEAAHGVTLTEGAARDLVQFVARGKHRLEPDYSI